MIKTTVFFLLAALCVPQFCQATVADDAEDALTSLRKTAMGALNGVYEDQLKIANDVDATALDTKALGDGLDTCVDAAAKETVDQLYEENYKSIDLCLDTIYTFQKAIIVCGRANEECLTKLIAEMKKFETEIPDSVKEGLDASRAIADQQIEVMKKCAA